MAFGIGIGISFSFSFGFGGRRAPPVQFAVHFIGPLEPAFQTGPQAGVRHRQRQIRHRQLAAGGQVVAAQVVDHQGSRRPG
ncbi:hypothetical protein HML84_07125 [Alcanivorax sp. IO_7]|nr:hypothetical protein HML84_07125 [Alcanivorax sp. IO_7]